MRALLVTSTALMLAACAATSTPVPEPATQTAASVDLPYREAADRGESVFRVEPGESSLIVYVYRGGSLARLGHDHVISGGDLGGYILLTDDASASRADVYLGVEQMTIDDPALRAEAGFDTQPSEQDIEGTRDNLLNRVLDAAAFPYLELAVTVAMGTPPRVLLDVDLTWQGITRTVSVPADVEIGDDRIRVRGSFEVWQSAFGIQPFSVLGGALRVEDRIDIQFELSAKRWIPE